MNSDFEGGFRAISGSTTITGMIGNGWSDESRFSGNAVTAQYAAAPGRTGMAQSITISEAGGGRTQMTQWLPLANLQKYTYVVYLKGSAPMRVRLQLRQRDAPYARYVDRWVEVTTEWRQYVLSGRVWGGMAGVALYFTEPGTLYIDDAALVGAPAPVTPPAKAIPRTYFGIHQLNLNGLHGPVTPVPAAFGAYRLHDTGVSWRDVNPARGRFDFTRLDASVSRIRAANPAAEILYVLGQTPRWAAARPTDVSVYGDSWKGAPSEPANLDDFREYVRKVAERYGPTSTIGRISQFEVWNEPNDRKYFSGPLQTLVAMARIARAELKAVSPDNLLVSPGTSSDQQYALAFLRQGGAAEVDAIGYHPYGFSRPEANAILAGNLRMALDEAGHAVKPLWITEDGWFNGKRFPSVETEIAYITVGFVLDWAFGAERYYHYKWDGGSGQLWLTDEDETTLTPAGAAQAQVQRWLQGATMRALDHAGGVWTAELVRGATVSRVVWVEAAPAALTIPAAWGPLVARNVDGKTTPVTQSLTVGVVPTLLERAP